MRKNSISENEVPDRASLGRVTTGRSGFRTLRLPIICIAVGIAVLYCSERSIASLFDSSSDTTSAFATVEAFATATFQSMWKSATGGNVETGTARATSSAPAASTPQARAVATQKALAAETITSPALNNQSVMLGNSAATSSSDLTKPTATSLTVTSALPSRISPILPDASIAGTGWKGTAGSNWSTAANWDSNGPAADERNLFFGNAWRDAGATGSTTSNNDLNFTGYRITFQDNGFGNPAASFTLTGNAITMADFSGNAPGIQNDSGLDQNININLTIKSGVGSAFVTDNNGNINFGGTLSLDTGNGNFQFNLQGNSGPTINFNGAVSNGGLRIAQTGNENVIFAAGLSGAGDYLKQGTGTVTFKTTATTFGGGGSNVFLDQGTVAVATGGSIGTTNGTTTGLINMDPSTGGLNTVLSLANSGITLANPILVRYLQTGGKLISGTFASGNSTYSGAISLADHLSIAAANGGTLIFSGVISQAAGTGSNTPGAGLVNNTSPSGGFSTNGPGVIINSGASSTGIVEYDNAMTYNGDTVVNSGTLQFNGSGSPPTAPFGLVTLARQLSILFLRPGAVCQ